MFKVIYFERLSVVLPQQTGEFFLYILSSRNLVELEMMLSFLLCLSFVLAFAIV